MLITLKYFGMLVEITNVTQESYSLKTDTCSLKIIELEILKKHPKLENTTYNIAINQKIGSKESLVKDGDELAFLPPFAGG